MSFNKCYLTQEKVLRIYNENKSVERIRNYLNSYDSHICHDEFSSNLTKVYYDLPDKELKKLLENLVI